MPIPADSAGAGSCRQQVSLLGVDEVSALGFAARSVLTSALGSRSSTLFWAANTAPASYGPEQGESRIELVLEYRGGAVRLVHWQENADAGAAPALECSPDSVEIDVAAALHTSGGALDERFAATLSATMPGMAQLSQSFALDALSGSFQLALPASYSARELTLNVSLNGNSFQGTLATTLTQTVGSSSSGQFIPLASWPAPTTSGQ